jgi:hypothetical protein
MCVIVSVKVDEDEVGDDGQRRYSDHFRSEIDVMIRLSCCFCWGQFCADVVVGREYILSFITRNGNGTEEKCEKLNDRERPSQENNNRRTNDSLHSNEHCKTKKQQHLLS